jgi:alpha-glucosidase (family GH31 glycosyl hydrolase)
MGLNNNIYIKSPNGTNLEGQVWPGNVNYPDWFNPNTSLFWDIGLNLLYEEVPFSGIWLDMNEASNFVPGENGFKPDKDDLLNLPPYKPTKPQDFIFTKTMRMDALHHGGILENNVHNTFGFLESKATYNFLKTIDDLTFIVTRSSFYGSGRYTAHWTGDNGATFEFLAVSIPGIINSGIYGLPMTGADICGFAGNTNEELCSRWFQLGSLYPFSRDHNDDSSIPQEPYAFGPTLLFTARHNLKFRYAILKHYYAQFLKQKGTGTIFRPVFFEFPTDDKLFDSNLGYTDSQFLIGKGLMAAPALKKGVNSVNVYFPKDTWFDFLTGDLIKTFKQEAGTVTRPALLNTTAPIFIRGGHIVSVQDTQKVNRTDDLDNIYTLVIAFKETEKTGYHYALGDMVGIKNFDSQTVMAKCRLDNCLYTVNASIVNYGGEFDLVINFFAQGTPTKYEQIQIKRLFMMGDWANQFDSLSQMHNTFDLENNVGTTIKVEQLAPNVLDYSFDTPFNVKPGAQIKIHLSNQNAELINI